MYVHIHAMYKHNLSVAYPDSVLGDLVDILHHGIEPAADERGDGAYRVCMSGFGFCFLDFRIMNCGIFRF